MPKNGTYYSDFFAEELELGVTPVMYIACMDLSIQNKVKPYEIRNIRAQLQYAVHGTAAMLQSISLQTITRPTQYNYNICGTLTNTN